MNGILTINLYQLRFFAFHGLYPEEQKTGNDFEVDLSVSYIPGEEIITDLSQAINYSTIYAFIKEEMQKPRELLETFVMETAEKIHIAFPIVKKISISITKVQAPIAGLQGRIRVDYTKEFS